MSIVKRQHYVWRKYLRAWSNNDQITTLLKESNEVTRIGLMGVAQEKYFYKLKELTHEEFRLLEDLISKSHPSVQGLFSDFLSPYRAFADISEKFRKNPNQEFEEELKKIEINTIEKIHGQFEANGLEFIACETPEQLSEILSSPDKKNSTLIYLCVQYYRTSKMKNNVLNIFRQDNLVKMENIWTLVSLIMSINTARNIALDPKIKFRFFENFTNTPFLTGDQPVLNIRQNEIDESGNVKELEFFYPISPKVAISIHFEESQKCEIEQIIIGESMVEYFNDFIVSNSQKFVFGNDQEYLKKKRL